MRTSLSAMAIAACSAAMLAACSGLNGGSQTPSSLPGAGTNQARALAERGVILPSGVDTRYGTPALVPSRLILPLKKKHATVEKDLFVSGGSDTVSVLKNKTYASVGTITAGVNGADGIWADNKGNVYVANYNGANVTEYKKGKGSPTCTYSTGIVDPINVTTDNAGNVYVDDFNKLQNPGYIDKFPQCSNTMSAQYDVSDGPEGVAVDKSGDIFVEYFGANGGNFEEFKAGSTTPTPLSVYVGSAGGMVIDNKGDLIAVDQANTAIDVIAPPYTTATTLVTDTGHPFHVSLNKKEKLLFSADLDAGDVTVYDYPSGSLVTTISSGISGAYGVTDSPDASF